MHFGSLSDFPPFTWLKVCLFMQQGRPISSLSHVSFLCSPKAHGQVINRDQFLLLFQRFEMKDDCGYQILSDPFVCETRGDCFVGYLMRVLVLTE